MNSNKTNKAIDYLNPFAVKTLEDRYMVKEDTCYQDVFYRSIKKHCTGEHLERMLDYVGRLWFIPSTPCLANGGTERGSEIACFLPPVQDSREGLNEHYTEINWLSSNGGGVGGGWSDIRSNGSRTSKGSVSNGLIPFLGIIDRAVIAFAQGGTRRASYAAYLDISHPEIEEFIDMRRPTGGDLNRKCLNLHHGVVLTDGFMQAVYFDLEWNLVDPHSKQVTKTMSARELWGNLLETRAFTGEPFILFKGNAEKTQPELIKYWGVPTNQSNLCTEILSATQLPNGEPATGVCCLGSLNLGKWDEYCEDINQVVEDCLLYLGLVLDNFIKTEVPGTESARKNAAYWRDVGLGTVGFHSYLQSHCIPFGSAPSYDVNDFIFSSIHEAAQRANKNLAGKYWETPASADAIAAGADIEPVAFTHMLAIAPNASTSLFTNTSGGVEPVIANVVIRKTATGTSIQVNQQLLDTFKLFKVEVTDELLQDIAVHNGSVQHLDIPNPIKQAFKTAYEIDQMHIIRMAGERQKYLDHTQSVNLFLVPETPRSRFSDWHMEAYMQGLPTLYYCRSLTQHKASTGVEQIKVQQDYSEETCTMCAN